MKNTKNGKSTEEKSTKGNQDGSQFEEFFFDALKDIYWAEKHLTKALPKMVKASTSEELQNVFKDHLEVTKGHVTKLEKAFELLGKKAQAKKCEAMDGLTKEAEDIIGETEKGSMTRDMALIMAAQKVEHYEIATYGGMARLAKTMGREDVAEIFVQILDEEKEADMTLTDVAENNINVEALEETEK